MRQEIAGHVARVDEEILVLDADVHVGAEDQQTLGQIAHVVARAKVVIVWRDLLRLPVRERMRTGGGDAISLLRGQLHNTLAQHDQFITNLRRCLAHRRADFDDRLMHLRLHLRQHAVIFGQQLRHIRDQITRNRIDDLVLFLDAQCQ